MASRKYKAELEVDDERGVVYVHLTNPDDVTLLGLMTPVRLKVMEYWPNHLLPIDGILLKPSYAPFTMLEQTPKPKIDDSVINSLTGLEPGEIKVVEIPQP